MSKDPNLEERLRRYATGFRREANPRANLPMTLISGLERRPRPTGPLAMVPAVAMAVLVVVAAVGLGYGAIQLRNAKNPTPTPPISLTATASQSASPTASASPSASASATATAAPVPTPRAQPGVVPGLAAIQMVGSHLGWAVGSHGVYATTDGVHWTKQYSSSEEFIGVDFISTTTGWAVGVGSLLGTTDGGRTWHQLGEPQEPLRLIHFSSVTQGWGVAGGGDPIGTTSPGTGAVLVATADGGLTWKAMTSPSNPQAVCFTDSVHGWLAASNVIYRSQDGGRTWNQSLTMYPPVIQPGWARIECAAPSALWVDWAPGGAATGHAPYVVYATVDGSHWRTVMAEPFTVGNSLPGVPAGPGSYPGSFSVVDPADAVFVGDTPPADSQSTMIASNGGGTLKSTGGIPLTFGTFGSAFISTSTGWVLAQNENQQIVIEMTSDGGYHWSQQLAVPR
jgi:photosystem II stability/assembly factor-like uncharacterized protein